MCQFKKQTQINKHGRFEFYFAAPCHLLQQLRAVAENLITVEPAETSKSSMYYNLQFLKQSVANVVIQVGFILFLFN